MVSKKSSYMNVFPEIFEECIEGIEILINKLKSKSVKEDFIDKHLDLLSLEYTDAAIGEAILNSELVKSKQYFYLSAKIQEILFEKYDDKTIKVSLSFATISRYTKILLALISDNDLLVDSLVHLIGGRVSEEKGQCHPFSKNVGYAVKYILLNEYDKAMENVNILKSMKDNLEIRLHKGYAVVLESIIRNDIENVNGGLIQMLSDHKKMRRHKDSPDELFCVPVVGFAKLAKRKGIEININDAIAPMAILEKQDIVYPEIEFINYRNNM